MGAFWGIRFWYFLLILFFIVGNLQNSCSGINVSKSSKIICKNEFSNFVCAELNIFCSVIDSNTIRKYHYYVNRVELFICKKEYIKATTFYDSSFCLSTTPFAQDIYNAAICEIKTENYEKGLQYCLKLIDKGCTISFFDKSNFSKLRSQHKYWSRLQKEYPKQREGFLKRVDTTLITTIHKMVIADQNYFCERPKRLNDNIFLDSLFNNDKFLSQSLNDLFKKHGYLSEEVIGVNVSDTIMSVYPIFNVLIRHHYQLKEYDLTTFLTSAVKNGLLKPDIFCSWYTFQKKPVGYGEDFFIKKYKCNFYEAQYESIKQKIAHNRSTMWLPPLNELKEKIILIHCFNNQDFALYAPLAVLPETMDSKSEESLKMFNTLLPYKDSNCR